MLKKRYPRGIAFQPNKKGQIRAYYIGHDFRYFPLPLAEARALVASGEAAQVPYAPFQGAK